MTFNQTLKRSHVNRHRQGPTFNTLVSIIKPRFNFRGRNRFQLRPVRRPHHHAQRIMERVTILSTQFVNRRNLGTFKPNQHRTNRNGQRHQMTLRRHTSRQHNNSTFTRKRNIRPGTTKLRHQRTVERTLTGTFNMHQHLTHPRP